MTLKFVVLLAVVVGLAGIVVGYFLRLIISLGRRGSMELEIREMYLSAKEEAQKIIDHAEGEATEKIEELQGQIKEKEEKLRKTEDRLITKEAFLDKRQFDIDQEQSEIKEIKQELDVLKEQAKRLEEQRKKALENVSKITIDEAKNELLKIVEEEQDEDIRIRMQKLENAGQKRIEDKAKEILTSTIQRIATSVSSDIFSTIVPIPGDDVKGKIIGKEGRNIKAFERMSGVEVIIDDTPGAITISSFDPVRRQIARIALENLIADGRIQPARIEHFIEKAKNEVNKIIREKGEQAAYEAGAFGLDPKLISLLGRLYFRTSYGQNVLQHSLEMVYLSGMIAEEVGANVKVAKIAALLHDIGKAVDHEVAGSHVEIGRRILQKFGVEEEIIKAMQAHHEEYPYENLESIIIQIADSISGSRPGARRDTVDNYLKRLEDLERIANSFKGVEKSYALQAGREIRIFVTPDQITDLDAKKMARNIAIQIEKELKYPGEIKVVVIRENRAIEFAR